MIVTQVCELKDLLEKEKIEIPQEVLKKNDLVIVPSKRNTERPYVDVSIVPTLKEMKRDIPKTEIYPAENLEYKDFRSADFQTPLFIILEDYVRPIVLALIARWIGNIISEHLARKKADPENKLLKEPAVRVRFYQDKAKKYFEIEGNATAVQEIEKDLLKQD